MRKTERLLQNNPLIFILGIQRSGTTWLTNIFDSSPDSMVFMEPFAPTSKIFPEFPKTNLFIKDSNACLDKLIQKEMMKRLLRHKSLLPFTSLLLPNLFPLERKIVSLWKKNNYKYMPYSFKSHVKKFSALNYHKMEDAFPIYNKHSHPNYWVIKELRLAGKLPLFIENFPNAHYVVIIRHPAATVNSIINWFEKNRLGELRRDISDYISDLETQSISKLYNDKIGISKSGQLAHILALYWRISYETIFSQLRKNGNFHVIIYEQMVNEPKKIIAQLFNDIGISWNSSVDDYLAFSTRNSIQINNPISTIRKSIDYKYWIDQISIQDKMAILEIVKESFLVPYFEPYY